MPATCRWVSVAAVLLSLAAAGEAQVRASERGGAFQEVNGTTVTVEFGRPEMRGRTDIYGGLIPWGKVWTPGANWATTLEVDADVTVGGQALRKGKYSVWMEVQRDRWTVILDPRARIFHTAPPPFDSAQVRFAVRPTDQVGPEILTWTFTDVGAGGTTLQMAWAGKAVAFDIGVAVPAVPPIARDAAAPYVGSYEVIFGPGSGQRTIPSQSPPEWVVQYADGRLVADWAHPPFPVWHHMWLLKIGDDWFHPGAVVDGALYDVVTDLVVEFAVAEGRATGFEIRGPNDAIVGRGRRLTE